MIKYHHLRINNHLFLCQWLRLSPGLLLRIFRNLLYRNFMWVPELLMHAEIICRHNRRILFPDLIVLRSICFKYRKCSGMKKPVYNLHHIRNVLVWKYNSSIHTNHSYWGLSSLNRIKIIVKKSISMSKCGDETETYIKRKLSIKGCFRRLHSGDGY